RPVRLTIGWWQPRVSIAVRRHMPMRSRHSDCRIEPIIRALRHVAIQLPGGSAPVADESWACTAGSATIGAGGGAGATAGCCCCCGGGDGGGGGGGGATVRTVTLGAPVAGAPGLPALGGTGAI